MVSMLVTFLSSGAGGALFGFFIDYLRERRTERKERAQQEHEKFIAQGNQINDYAKIIQKPQSGVIKQLNRKFRLWGFEVNWTKYKVYAPVSYNPRARAAATVLMWLSVVYGIVLLTFAIEPQLVVWTFLPDPDPIKFNVLIFGFEVPRTKTLEVTTGGIAYVMAHPVIFIIATVLTGVTGKLGR